MWRVVADMGDIGVDVHIDQLYGLVFVGLEVWAGGVGLQVGLTSAHIYHSLLLLFNLAWVNCKLG